LFVGIQFVFELCKRGVGFLTITDVPNVAVIGECSEVKSNLIVLSVYVEEIPLVTKKSSRSGILFPSVGQYVGVPVDRNE
jgi:hypothetical protein